MTGKSNPNESISSTVLKQNGALNAMVIMVWLHLGRLECSGAVLWSVLKQNSGPEGCGARSRRPLQLEMRGARRFEASRDANLFALTTNPYSPFFKKRQTIVSSFTLLDRKVH